jgi:hypothetical protein
MKKVIAKVGQPGGGRWVLIEDERGQGGFLAPPGHASHSLRVEEYRGSRSSESESSLSVDSALTEEWVPSALKVAICKAMAQYEAQCTEDWVQSIYSYFGNCYSPDGVNRNVSDCLIVKANEGGFGYVTGPFGADGWLESLPPAEHHLGYLYVKQYFPEHTPRTDLIED